MREDRSEVRLVARVGGRGLLAFLALTGLAACGSGTTTSSDDGNDAQAPSADAQPYAADAGTSPTDGAAPATDAARDGANDGGSAATDAAAGARGHAGETLASGASVAKSAHYQAVLTLGESPGGNATSESAHYRVRGGVVGATQSP